MFPLIYYYWIFSSQQVDKTLHTAWSMSDKGDYQFTPLLSAVLITPAMAFFDIYPVNNPAAQ